MKSPRCVPNRARQIDGLHAVPPAHRSAFPGSSGRSRTVLDTASTYSLRIAVDTYHSSMSRIPFGCFNPRRGHQRDVAEGGAGMVSMTPAGGRRVHARRRAGWYNTPGPPPRAARTLSRLSAGSSRSSSTGGCRISASKKKKPLGMRPLGGAVKSALGIDQNVAVDVLRGV
jgi:hypothetical protein